MKTQCQRTYESEQDIFKLNIQKLKEKIKQHKEEWNKSKKTNWGYVGDLNHINNKLEDILKFLRG